MKKQQIIKCISRLFTTTSQTIKSNEKTVAHEYCLKLKQRRPMVPKPKHWATFAAGKKTCKMYNFKAADEWFAVPPINTQLTKPVECVYDEKVEMVTPLEPTPPVPCKYEAETHNRSPSLHIVVPSQSEETDNTKALIDSQKVHIKDRIPIAETIELASMVSCVLGEAFTVADSKIFDKDDFYDSLRKNS
ncbi:hypothetical protein [Parasitella parasitica]|uniref:Uncharacterized protein n=1 Tax=Parasitella parasitica TaxID=35722 RepID=A0A0B7MN26_9FUNG|nr:hypothetical protein [Parasitella parasitica]